MASQPPLPSLEGNPVLTYYREWAEKTPCITRISMISLVVSYLVSFLISTALLLGNIPFFTLFNFEIYRLLLSPLVGNSFMSLTFVALLFPGLGARVENCLGSCAFLSLIGTLTLVTNIAFAAVCLFLNIFDMPEAMFFHCHDFWIVLFGLITMECAQAPEHSRRMMGIPVDIPNKYYPLVLYVLFILLGGPRLDYLIAAIVGFLYEKGYFDRVKPSSFYLENLEAPTGVLNTVSRSKGWVLAGSATGHDSWIALNSTTAASGGGVGGAGSVSAPGGPGGPGGNILRGWNTWAAQETGTAGDTGSDPSAATPFIGTGRTLGATATSTEDVAARRFAALSQQQGGSPIRGDRVERADDMQRRHSVTGDEHKMDDNSGKNLAAKRRD